MTLDELIDALEKATGPDEDLDEAIADTLGVRGWCFDDEGIQKIVFSAEPYTESLDAALTLVPDGHDAVIYTAGGAEVFKPVTGLHRHDMVYAATPALALCIAALRARKARDE